MKKTPLLSAFIFLAAVIAAGTHADLRAAVTDDPLQAPCTRYDDVYDDMPFNTASFESWPILYHTTVDTIVQEHLSAGNAVVCTALGPSDFAPPRMLLKELASTLPPWRDDEDLAELSQQNIGAVLLEQLRVYECLIQEHELLLTTEAARSLRGEDEEDKDGAPDPAEAQTLLQTIITQAVKRQELGKKDEEDETVKEPGMLQFGEEVVREVMDSEREKRIARTALERTLLVLSGIDRLRPVDQELQCIQEFSYDIRNVSGLIAEASSCLPRIWDSKNPAQEMYQCFDGQDNDDDGDTDLSDSSCTVRTNTFE